MSFWDDVFKRAKATTGEVESTLKKEATRRAASAALRSFTKKAGELAEDFVSTAERELEASRSARSGSPEASQSEASQSEASQPTEPLEPQATAPSSKRETLAERRQAREDRARKELEAIKARLASDAQGGDDAQGSDAS